MKRHFFRLFIIHLVLIFFVGCNSESDDKVYTSVVEGTSVQVPALTGGQILRFDVDTGIEVQPGDMIALVDTIELHHQRQQLLASLDELKIQLQIARTGLKQAQANYRYLKQKQQRIAMLVEKKSAPRQSLDDLTNQLEQAEAALDKARQNTEGIEARRKRLIAQLSTVAKKINDAVIRAPIAGIVTEKYYEANEAVPPASPIVEIIDIRKVEVKIYVSETKLPEIKYGQSATIKVDGSDEQLSGQVSWVSPKAEFTPKTILTPQTRTSLVYAVKITVQNPEGVLKHGMPVEVALKN